MWNAADRMPWPSEYFEAHPPEYRSPLGKVQARPVSRRTMTKPTAQ